MFVYLKMYHRHAGVALSRTLCYKYREALISCKNGGDMLVTSIRHDMAGKINKSCWDIIR